MNKKIHIGLIDSGCDAFTCKGYFLKEENGTITPHKLKHDHLQHGTTIANIITDSFATFTCMQVFDTNLATSIQKISYTINALCDENIDLIHMSFGLQKDDKGLKHAIKKAHQQNTLLIASTPTISPHKIYPASYEEVISVTADARCSYDEISFLNNHALFGASTLSASHKPLGSSIAAAHITKEIAKLWQSKIYTKNDLIASLQQLATYKSPQNFPKKGVAH